MAARPDVQDDNRHGAIGTHGRPAATFAERPVLCFQRVNDTPTGLAAYRVGPPQAAALWQPTRTTAPAAGRLHEVVRSCGAWVDVSGLRTAGTLAQRRKNIARALRDMADEVKTAAPQLAAVFATLELRIDDGRIVARVFDRTTGFRIEG